MTAEPPFVFICHPSEADDVAATLTEFLEMRMVAVWFDAHIDGGVLWSKVLNERLLACGALIVLVAPEIDDLTWLKREIGMARELHKPIFPVLLPGAAENELRALGIDRIQALRLDGQPPPKWVRSVHDALYPTIATSATPAAPPVRVRPDRRIVVTAAAVGAITGLVLGWLGSWLFHSPAHPGKKASPVATTVAPGPCGGLAAHIDKVSTVSPGHTGYTPQITVTVCTPGATGHFYWLMNYTVGGDGRRFYAQAKVDGSTGSRPYRVVHDQSTGANTPRTYLVLDVPAGKEDEVAGQWTTPDGAPFVAPGTDLPAGVTRISNEVPAVL